MSMTSKRFHECIKDVQLFVSEPSILLVMLNQLPNERLGQDSLQLGGEIKISLRKLI
jgi:hypothetical protein